MTYKVLVDVNIFEDVIKKRKGWEGEKGRRLEGENSRRLEVGGFDGNIQI